MRGCVEVKGFRVKSLNLKIKVLGELCIDMRGCVWFEGFRVSLPPVRHGGLRFDEHIYASFVCIMFPPTEYGECVYCKIAIFLHPARNLVLQSTTLHVGNCKKIHLEIIPDQ